MSVNKAVITNSEGATIAGAINAVLDDVYSHPNKSAHELWIATAYFNAGGFDALEQQITRAGKVKILLGADPQPALAEPRALKRGKRPGELERVRDAIGGQVEAIAQDRDLLGFDTDTNELVERLIEWLRSGKVEVKRYTKGFLHGKAFIIATGAEAVMAGSANFTAAGLLHNEELNLGVYGDTTVQPVVDWYTRLWEEAEDFDLAEIFEAKFQEFTPYQVWLRFLLERYGAEIADEGPALIEDNIKLAEFQADGVRRAKKIIDEHRGVLVAEGVGLGKTWLAGKLISEYVRERRQRVLVVAPAALRDGPWAGFLDDQALGGVDCISYQELATDPQVRPPEAHIGSAAIRRPITEYGLVVIDEAHALRNPLTQMSRAMRKLLEGSPPKDVVLLTATPVNNRLEDLREIISLFITNDSAFAPSIRSLKERFDLAEAMNPDDLSPEHLLDVLDAVAVRRTRRLVKEKYPKDYVWVDGVKTPVTFPKPEVRAVRGFTLDDALPGLFAEVEYALAGAEGPEEKDADIEDPNRLSLGRYTPSRFLPEEDEDRREIQFAGLLRSHVLKRFESSVFAFAETCRAMVKAHDAFLDVLAQGQVADAQALREWVATDSDDLDDWLIDGGLKKGVVEDAKVFDVEKMRAAVTDDRDLLQRFADRAATVAREQDPKLAELLKALKETVKEAESGATDDDNAKDRRKVVVFSYYADTVSWVAEYLRDAIASDPDLAPYVDGNGVRLATLTGEEGSNSKVLFGFAPKSSKAPPGSDDDLFDIVVCTDVLAEGVNLQQARNVINYDLPWNPMRLVQRHGRIDRIGSQHKSVVIRCLMDDELDRFLQLEERLMTKVTKAAKSIGVEGEILPGSMISDHGFEDTKAEIERLRDEDAELFETAGERGSALSAEYYRQELKEGLASVSDRKIVEKMPWGAGSGYQDEGLPAGQMRFVFCARVGDHPLAQLRQVVIGSDGALVVEADTQAALSRARATKQTGRSVSDGVHSSAYDAWAAVRSHILEEWKKGEDPRASLATGIPKAMREASELIGQVTPTDMSRAAADELQQALIGRYRETMVKVFRGIIRGDETDQRKADRVAEEAKRFSLRKQEPPEPLPQIALEDIYLVCWQAVEGTGPAAPESTESLSK